MSLSRYTAVSITRYSFTFRTVRSNGAHLLIKGSNPEFRSVLQDAQFLFTHEVVEEVETDSGFDYQRYSKGNFWGRLGNFDF